MRLIMFGMTRLNQCALRPHDVNVEVHGGPNYLAKMLDACKFNHKYM